LRLLREAAPTLIAAGVPTRIPRVFAGERAAVRRAAVQLAQRLLNLSGCGARRAGGAPHYRELLDGGPAP